MLIATESGRVEAQWWGERTATTLVLLHEGLGCVALWRDFPERLAAASGLGVFAWSRPGYGLSDPVPLPRPLDYMQRAARGEVAAVLDAAGIERCVLVGHSDGASIAALVTDPRVAGKILIAPHYFTEEAGLAAIRATDAAFRAGGLRERMAKYHGHVDIAFRGWADAWLDRNFPRSFRIADAASAACIMPVLQIQGSEDPYGTTAQTDALRGPDVTTVVLTAKHAPHLEAPEATMAAILGFLARIA
jgi:pimeloyl-ACP methyl ester carboxylesterase